MNTKASWTTPLLSLLVLAAACRARQRTASPDAAPTTSCCAVTVYDMPEVEEQASFPGSETAMYAWVGNNLTYPEKAAETGVQGTCWVQFNIECDGALVDVQMKKGVDPELDSAAMDLVRRMPRWTPGKMKGEVVCVQYILPVKFTLK